MTWRIHTDIPHGNAALAEIVEEDDGATAVKFSADPHGGTESLWWCFRLSRDEGGGGGESPEVVRLVWRHYCNCLGLNKESPPQLHPVVRRDGGAWERLPAGAIADTGNGCPEAVWETAAPRQWLEAAFCFPHSPGHVEDFITASSWHRDCIGVSQKGREILRIANDYGEDGGGRPGIYCVSHQHASEMSGSWVLQGFLEEMDRQGDNAPLVWSVPMVNIDGLVEGDYGKDPFPWDVNRSWGWPPMRHEALACMRDIGLWQSRCDARLCLDFHSPGGAEDNGVYSFIMNPEAMPEAHAEGATWCDALSAGLGEYASENFKRVANYPGRFRTAEHTTFSKFYCRDKLLGMTFEIPYHKTAGRVLSIEDYLDIGRRMGEVVCGQIRKLPSN